MTVIRGTFPSSSFGLCLPLMRASALPRGRGKERERLAWDHAISDLSTDALGSWLRAWTTSLRSRSWGAAILIVAALCAFVPRVPSRPVVFLTAAVTGASPDRARPRRPCAVAQRSECRISERQRDRRHGRGRSTRRPRPVERRRVLSAVALGSLFVAAYGFSFVYLGWSNLTYVIAGWCVAMAWVSVLLLRALRTPRRKVGPYSATGADTPCDPSVAGAAPPPARRRLPRLAAVPVRHLSAQRFAWLRPLRMPDLHDSTYHELPWVGRPRGPQSGEHDSRGGRRSPRWSKRTTCARWSTSARARAGSASSWPS